MPARPRPVIVAASVILVVSFVVMLLAYGVRHSFPVFSRIISNYCFVRIFLTLCEHRVQSLLQTTSRSRLS